MLNDIDAAISLLAKAITPDDGNTAATLSLAILNLVKSRETLAHSLRTK